MKVGFVHLGPVSADTSRLIGALIASVRRVMPGLPIVHLTDETTPDVTAADEVFRRPVSQGEAGPLIALGVLELYAAASAWVDKSQPCPRWIFVDTDVLFQAAVDHVFQVHFDIAVANRDGTFRPGEEGSKFMTAQPYNKGVVFSTGDRFWRQCVQRLRAMKPARQAWMGDQIAVNTVIAEQCTNVYVLDARYNYPPRSKDDAIADKFITHWKGPRKAWLLERAA